MRPFSFSVVSRSLKYSSTTSGFRALAQLRSSLSVFLSVSLGCRFLKLAHQCSPGPYSWLKWPSLPEHFANSPRKGLYHCASQRKATICHIYQIRHESILFLKCKSGAWSWLCTMFHSALHSIVKGFTGDIKSSSSSSYTHLVCFHCLHRSHHAFFVPLLAGLFLSHAGHAVAKV